MIYFIQAGRNGPIKIGLSVDPVERLRVLQCAHYRKLHLLATAPGHRKKEAAIHKRLCAHRIRGEWFADVPAVHGVIEELRLSTADWNPLQLMEAFRPRSANHKERHDEASLAVWMAGSIYDAEKFLPESRVALKSLVRKGWVDRDPMGWHRVTKRGMSKIPPQSPATHL